jgi:serine/threonine protein phosphatase PrpC
MKVHPTSFGLASGKDGESHDAFAVKAWDETVIAVVADGAGSSLGAREAAQRAVRSLVGCYETRPRTWSPGKALNEFTRRLNRSLHQDSLARFGSPELVTTLSVAVVEGDRLYGLNVGDSRVYLARGGNLNQLSQDHIASPAGLEHVLGRALGLEPEVEPHAFEMELRDGDLALLCSDGITNVLDAGRLADHTSRRSAARTIVSTAREQATPEKLDDMSAIVLDIEKTGQLRAVKEQPLEIPQHLGKGDVIDGFTLLRPFQQSDRVWLASRENRRYTLKFAPIEARENEELLGRFIQEIWHATRLQDCEFFPRAFVPEPAAHRFYALEFIEAPSLKMLLGSRSLAVDETVALGKFLLAAAQHLLSLDLVHGDTKPENILVVPGYDTLQFRLIDFGSVTEAFSLTSRAGTASYLAPERFHEAPISERTEIFAIGVTLFEAATRAFPYGEIERFQTPRFRAAKRPTSLNANLPPWFEAVLLRALAPEPERRYQNYSEMLYDLNHPDQVRPYYAFNAPFLERDPLFRYKTGFYLLLAVTIALLLILLLRKP